MPGATGRWFQRDARQLLCEPHFPFSLVVRGVTSLASTYVWPAVLNESMNLNMVLNKPTPHTTCGCASWVVCPPSARVRDGGFPLQNAGQSKDTL